ncbi:MAG TPA: hypothetical protein VF258_10020, partial [Luteolibacter sp.]
WAVAGRPLIVNPDLNGPLNPLGVNGSPYGEVFAMAMQTPIDTFFHEATHDTHHHHEDGEECHDCKHHEEEASDATTASVSSLPTSLQNLLSTLAKTAEVRTNPKAASDAHKRYLRRQVEDKLRFAYQLDPAHYGNYNSLHFFLTEPQLGTRPQLTPSAAKLAEDTIQYCLKQENDPRPALTAAAAATNILHLMFNDQLNKTPKFNTTHMREYLNLLDHCIARYATLAKQWDGSKQWELLSPQRIAECNERFHFIRKIRDAAEKTVIRFEGQPKVSQVSN